jgi:hypothetical protein
VVVVVVVELVALVGRSGGSPVAVPDVDVEELEAELVEDVRVLTTVVV